MQGDDPPFLPVGTDVSAKYKGAFCEAKIKKVVRNIKCKVTFKATGIGSLTVTDDAIKGTLRVGNTVEVKHEQKKEMMEAIITKMQDCSQYTVVFDDGDITTLRRSALCLKSGRHFNESETLDQLPLTHPEHFSTPVIGHSAGRRRRGRAQSEESWSDGEERGSGAVPASGSGAEREPHAGRVVLVECAGGGGGGRRAQTAFPGLVVAPTAQDTVKIKVKDEYLVRSFKDGRYYTVPKKEARDFKRGCAPPEWGGVEAALQFLNADTLPAHWDRDALFATDAGRMGPDEDSDDSSDDEPREEKDHFVAQLYKFMDDRGTPLNRNPTIANRDIDLYRLFRVVQKLGGCNRVTNQNQWKTIAAKMGFHSGTSTITNLCKQAYKKFLHSFEDFYRKLGVTLVAHPRGGRTPPSGRSLIRDRDRAPPTTAQPPAPPPQPAPAEPAPVKEEKPAPEVTTKVSASRAAKEKDKEVEKPKEKEIPVKEKEKEKERESKSIKSEKISTSDEDSGDNQPLVTTVRSEKGETEKTPERSAKTVKNSKPSTSAESKRVGRKDASTSHGAQRRSLKGRQTSREPPPVAVKAESRPKAASEPSKRSGERSGERDKHSREKDTPSRKQASTDSDSSGRGSRCAVGSKSTPSRRSQSANSASSTNTVSSNSSKKPKKRKVTGSQQSETSKGGNNTINAAVGDKLKVYYGPTHSESKVTYEAKVIEVSGRGADTLLRVHYTGWNTRYDEWIRPARIALNITHDQGKNKHKDKERMSTSSKRARAPPSASKPHTRNRTGSNATTASNSQHTDASVQSDTDSDSGSEQETSPPPQKRPSHDDKTTSAPNSACKEKPPTPNTSSKEPSVSPVLVKKEPCPATADNPTEDMDSKESPEKVLTCSNKSARLSRASAQLSNKRPAAGEGSPVRAKRLRVKVEEETPKGRDFDLNEIRSELKGLDIKNVIKSPVDNVRIEQEETVTEKEEPIIVVKTEKTPEKVTEDIYEFKEPEPFEFEARKSEEKKKRIPTHRIFDDLPQLKLSPTRSPEKPSSSPTESKQPTKSQYEEAFDKLCQTESYDNSDATEEPAEKEGETLSLFDELAGEDSGDRLVISEAEDSQEPLFTYENELFPADKNLLPIFKAFTPAKNQETYSKKDTNVKLPDIVDEFINSPIKEDQSSDEDPIDAAIQRVNTLPPSSDDSIDGDLLITSTTTTISLLDPYSPKPEVKPINTISEALTPVVTPEKMIEIPKKEENKVTNETTVITAVKLNVSPTIKATSPTVKEEVVTIKIIEKEVSKSPQEVKEPEPVSIEEVVPDTKIEMEILKPASPPESTHIELPIQPVGVNLETQLLPVKMKTDIELFPLVPSSTIADIMLCDNEDLKQQNKSDSECSTFVDVVIPEPPAGFLMHKEGTSIADKVLKAISSAKKAASLSPPFTSNKDNGKSSKIDGSKTSKTDISKCNKSDSLKLLATTKIERVKSPSSLKTDNPKPVHKSEVQVKSIMKLDPPVIGESVFGVEVPTAMAELDSKLEVTVTKVEPVTAAPLKMEVVERRKSGPEIPLPVIGKSNRVLSDTIQKLSSQISQPPAIPVASFQPEDTSDSDDSDQRLIIDKLSEDESQSGASSSETAGKPPETWGAREETARQAEEDSNISLLLCEETIPGSPAPAEREAKQAQGKPKSARSLQMPFASAPSNSPEQVAGKQATGKAGGEGVWGGLHELVPERRGTLDNTPPTTPDTSLDNMSPHPDNPMSDGEGLDSKICDEDIRNPGTSKKMSSDMDKATNGRTLVSPAAGGRSRKASESSCAGGRRGRRPRRHSDSEDADSTPTTLLHPSHHQRPLKYNFYVDLDPSWDCNARITLITSQLGELRKAYHGLKAELAAIDRRRKKLRRKEREAVKAAKAACS